MWTIRHEYNFEQNGQPLGFQVILRNRLHLESRSSEAEELVLVLASSRCSTTNAPDWSREEINEGVLTIGAIRLLLLCVGATLKTPCKQQ